MLCSWRRCAHLFDWLYPTGTLTQLAGILTMTAGARPLLSGGLVLTGLGIQVIVVRLRQAVGQALDMAVGLARRPTRGDF